MPSAEIITIGTEILLGEIVDTNTRYLAKALRGLGIDLYRTSTIGDNSERIASSIKFAMKRAEIIITTGGLGPTVDDPTREAVARAFDTDVEFREELWEQILERISRYGRKANENQKRQAYVPKGAKALKNEVGTAPAFVMEAEDRIVISLPGVPKEMEWLLHNAVIPYLQARYNLDEVIKVRLVHTAGTSEAEIDEKIGDLERMTNPTVGLAAHTGVVDVRIAAKAKTEAEADSMIRDVESQVRERLGEIIFGVDEDSLQEAALRTASERGWKLVAVEAGLDGSLKRKLENTQAANLLWTESAEVLPGELPVQLEKAMGRWNANAGLGVSIFPQDKAAELSLITPDGVKSRNLTFGGHPSLLRRWAINLALNWLRQEAVKADDW
jgi:nicotinamide-nucleotide amidase